MEKLHLERELPPGGKKPFFTVSLQCPLLTKLNMISASKTKIFKSPAPLWQNKRVSLELRNMKLIIGTVKVF